MNEWTERSIELAQRRGYLDKLQKVYPVNIGPNRELEEETVEALRNGYNKKDAVGLLKLLLEQEIFPIKHPYVPYLRNAPNSIQRNPKTVNMIMDYIFSLEFDDVLKGITKPKEPNTQMGSLFREWLKRRRINKLKTGDFIGYNGLALLNESDEMVGRFARERLNVKLQKHPDFLIRNGTNFVLGEAKYVGDYGGNQNAKVEEAMAFTENETGDAIKIAVLDGVVWIASTAKLHLRVKDSRGIALSSLLLTEFIKSYSRKITKE